MGLVYNPIHNRKDNNEITIIINRTNTRSTWCNNFYTFISLDYWNITFIWWCNVNVRGVTKCQINIFAKDHIATSKLQQIDF